MIFEFSDRRNIDAIIADQKVCAELLKENTDDQCLRPFLNIVHAFVNSRDAYHNPLEQFTEFIGLKRQSAVESRQSRSSNK